MAWIERHGKRIVAVHVKDEFIDVMRSGVVWVNSNGNDGPA